jgi:hypothetical protein
MRGRKLKFPNVKSCPPQSPAVLCPASRVIGLYNQCNGGAAQRISGKVRAWFIKHALTNGWAGVYFLPAIQTMHGVGCVLFIPPPRINVTITVTKETLVLIGQQK